MEHRNLARRLRVVAFFFLVATVFIPGPEAQSAGAKKTGTRKDRPALSQADRQRAIEFGQRVHQAMAIGEVGVLEDAVDYRAMTRDSLEGLSLSDQEIDEFSVGLVQGMKQSGGLAGQILGNTYRFLRLKTIHGRPALVFSLVAPEGSMNYHFLDIEVRGEQPRIVGFYSVATGEALNVTLRRLLIPLIAEQKKGFLSKLFGEDRGPAILKSYQMLAQMNLAAQQGDFATVIRTYESMDPEFKEDKLAMGVALMGYSYTEDDAKLTAVSAKYREKYPGDPSLPLMMFDSLFVERKWAEALGALDEIDEIVGGDPYLGVSRAGVYLEQGKHRQALEHALRAADGAGSVELTHWMVATAAAGLKDFERVAESCRTLRDFGYYFAPEMLDPVYAEFSQSAPALKLFEEDAKRMKEDGVTLADILGES